MTTRSELHDVLIEEAEQIHARRRAGLAQACVAYNAALDAVDDAIDACEKARLATEAARAETVMPESRAAEERC